MRKVDSWAALVVGSALVLAGCGGDGGGDGDGNPDVTPTAITEANSAQVSAVVYRAASVLFDVASSAGVLPVGAVVSAAPSRHGGGLGLASFAARQLKAVTGRPLPAASVAVGAVYQDTYQCTGGGTVTERIDDADDNGVESIGDSLKLTFVDCVEDGVAANGAVAFRLTLLSGNSTGAEVTFSDLRLDDGTDEIGANGAFGLTITENAGVSETYQIAGDRLTGSLNGDQHTLTGFDGSAATDLVLGTVTYRFAGRVADSSNSVVVDAATVNAFVARLADDFPGSGTLRSTGAANSQAVLEALSPTRVRISADPEGDGSFTAPVEWSWSALEALPG
jgi:hypothetical protein